MKILTGEIEPSNRGTITRPRKVGVLSQDQFAFDNERIIDTVMMGNEFLWEALQERDRLCEAADFTEKMGERLGELEEVIADENGYMAEYEAAEILRGIGIEDARHTDMMSTLSTDYKFRVLLAQAVFGEPEALLLDEPTNHMDLESIHWLEEFLTEYKGTLIVISHDRHFLNSVCTHIADIDYETVIIYPGAYDDMVDQKIQARQRIESANRDKAKKIAQLQEFVNKFSAGQRASQVQSRIKEMRRLAPEDLKRSNIQRPWIRFEQNRPSGQEVLKVSGLTKGFDGVNLFENLDLHVTRGEKIAIIGKNGVGKTTLIRCLIGELQPDAGEVKWGNEMNWGYYPQDYSDQIVHGHTALEWLEQYNTTEDLQAVRAVMGRMLFQGDDALKPTSALSGGETARLLMARLMLKKDPALIFDEPTNHLDLESVNALGEGLSNFPGTIFLVSHDRDLISDTATRVLSFTEDQGLIDFQGTYEEYLEKHPLPERETAGAY
jgi:ATPase subunit of ABC transporter with duplicated ATPase domains